MKAAVLHALGKAPRCEEFAEPAAGKDEAVVRVRAASLKAIDKQLASGGRSWGTRGRHAGIFWRAEAAVRRDGGAHRRAARILLPGASEY